MEKLKKALKLKSLPMAQVPADRMRGGQPRGLVGPTLLALLTVAVTSGLLWYAHLPPPPPQEATWDQVRAEAHSGGYRLLTTAELADRYRQDPQGLLLVDVRQDWEYRSGHLKGAVNFPIEPTWWGRWRAQRPLARLLGPDKTRAVVFY